jgi:hypothetical protein
MPGVRDRNLRSGDLHEELGLLLLRTVALVSPIPRQDDVGIDAFATLVRPDGSRRLLPDVSFLVQFKAASVDWVSYASPDALAWIANLEIPLFIGRVSLNPCRMELFSTQRLHQILLEGTYDQIHLLLDVGDESSEAGCRRANIGPPIHAWSLEDAVQPDFLTRAYEVLRPHVEHMRRNRLLRGIRYQQLLKWDTGHPPVDYGVMMCGSPSDDVCGTLREMVPYVHRLLSEVFGKRQYADFPVLLALVEMMRRWGVDPDPDGTMLRLTAYMAQGPEITDEDVIRLRHLAGFGCLDLSHLKLRDESLAAIPEEVERLAMADVPITDKGVVHLQRLSRLTRLNLAGTQITDSGLDQLTTLRNLRWLNVERTQVTNAGIDRLKAKLPDVEIVR